MKLCDARAKCDVCDLFLCGSKLLVNNPNQVFVMVHLFLKSWERIDIVLFNIVFELLYCNMSRHCQLFQCEFVVFSSFM